MKMTKPSVPTVKRVAGIATRKSVIVLFIWIVCASCDAHHIFTTIGKTGEFIIGSLTDHLLFDVWN